MAEALIKSPGQPFTPGGVARYAGAKAARLFGVAAVFAFFSAAVIAVFVATCWTPVIRDAVGNLPENGVIRGGVFEGGTERGKLLGANPFLAIAIVADAASDDGTPVDLAIQFARREVRLVSLLGAAVLPYPEGWTIALNRTALLPLWGAWESALPPLLFFGGALALLLTWSMLAVPYTIVLRFFAFVLRKPTTFASAWKTCVAAQWPGAILLSFVVTLYALGQAALALVLTAFVAHFLLTFLYLVFTPVCFRKRDTNPFVPEDEAKGRTAVRKKNPFTQ